MFRRILTASLCCGFIATAAQAQTLETDQQRTLYALGAALGSNVQGAEMTDEELAIVAAGMRDAIRNEGLQVDMQVYGPQIQQLVGERISAGAAEEKAASAEFVAEMAQQQGAERSETGVIFIPESRGSGPSPTAQDTVRVHYHGTLRDGTVFDSSVDRGEPVTFALNGVIPCWTEGVQKMRVGGTATLVCPSATAYGDAGQGPIPGGAALMFEVELLGIE